MYWLSSSTEEGVDVETAWFHGLNTGSSDTALFTEPIAEGSWPWVGETRAVVVMASVESVASAEPGGTGVNSGLAPVVL